MLLTVLLLLPASAHAGKAPVISGVDNVANYTENGPPIVIDSSITISDSNSTELNQATVSITGNFSSPQDQLVYSTINGITGSYSGTTGVLTLSGTATLAQYEQALESVQYQNSSDTPSTATRTISFVVRDTSNSSSLADTTTLNVLAMAEAPVIGDVDNVATYVENGPPVVIDPTITITDLDSTELNQAIVAITANFSGSQDVLIYSTVNGITGSYNSSLGILTLSGVATLAQYEEALESVQYQNTLEYPYYVPRTISFVVRDTSNSISAGDTTSLMVYNVNDLPVISDVDNVATYVENGPPVVIDPAITITDIDTPVLNQATVSITANFDSSQDVLIYSPVNGIPGSYDSSAGVLTLSGGPSGAASLSEYAQALESIQYQNIAVNLPEGTPPRTITFAVRDVHGGVSTAVTTSVNIQPVNSLPVISDVDNVVNYTENDPATVIDSSITITDVDSDDSDLATVSIIGNFFSSEDQLVYSTINGIIGTYNGSSGVLTLCCDATLAEYEQALETVKYQNLSESPNPGTRTISFSIRNPDAVNASVPVTTTVNVAHVNDLPVISDADNVANYTQNGPAVIIDSTLSVSDIDTPMLNQATVSITGNFSASEDMLVYSTLNGITGSYNSGTGVLTLTGGSPPTLWNYKQALESVRYQNSSENPSTAVRTISFMVRDVFNGSSAADTTTLTVNAAPVISDVDNVAIYTENDPPVIIDSTITIADSNSTELNQATVSITGNFNSPEDQLIYSTVNGIVGSYDGGAGVLTLSGVATLTQYEQALESVRYRNAAASPDTVARTISFAVRDAANAFSTAVSTTLNVAALPDADSDGVNDSDDLCPDTLSPYQPDANGCAAYQRDTDNDEVSDADDLCSATPPGEIVDGFGCAPSQLDTDSDGVADSNDFCPATPLGQVPDTLGCSSIETDSDQDGINDSYELVMGSDPQDPGSFPIDQNMDGIPDALLSAQGFWESPCNYLGGGQYQKEYLLVSNRLVREFHNSTSPDCGESWSVIRNHYSYTLKGISSDIGSYFKNQLLELNLVLLRVAVRLHDAVAADVLNGVCSKNDFAVGVENIANNVSCPGGILYPQQGAAHYDILSLTYSTLAPGEDSISLGNLIDRTDPQSRATQLATFSFSRVGQ